MSKKTVVSVDLLCSKCRLKVMKLISTIEGVNSISIDSENSVTVVGEADPVCIMKKVRKFRKTARIKTVGPAKEERKEVKKEALPPCLPKTCQKCDVWYVISEDIAYPYCTILKKESEYNNNYVQNEEGNLRGYQQVSNPLEHLKALQHRCRNFYNSQTIA